MPVQDSYQPPGGGSESVGGDFGGFTAPSGSSGSSSGTGTSGGGQQTPGATSPGVSVSRFNTFNQSTTMGTRQRANPYTSGVGPRVSRQRQTRVHPRLRLSDIIKFFQGNLGGYFR